jgi:hypothetical protein
MERTTVAVDLAKSVFQVAISKRPGKTSATHRLRRAEVAPFFSQYPSSVHLIRVARGWHEKEG